MSFMQVALQMCTHQTLYCFIQAIRRHKAQQLTEGSSPWSEQVRSCVPVAAERARTPACSVRQ